MGSAVKIGRLVVTGAAQIALHKSGQQVDVFLRRHERGDRGDALSAAECRLNALAETCEEPLLSAYHLRCGLILWVYTNCRLEFTSVMIAGEED